MLEIYENEELQEKVECFRAPYPVIGLYRKKCDKSDLLENVNVFIISATYQSNFGMNSKSIILELIDKCKCCNNENIFNVSGSFNVSHEEFKEFFLQEKEINPEGFLRLVKNVSLANSCTEDFLKYAKIESKKENYACVKCSFEQRTGLKVVLSEK